jgi:WD40 repeat protein
MVDGARSGVSSALSHPSPALEESHMTAPRALLCLAVLLGLWLGPLPAAEPRPRTESSGDVLPDRAIARLGTTRLQVGDSPTGLAYSPDGKLFAAVSYEGPVVVWSMPSGRKLHEFKVGRDVAGRMAFSKDGSYLAYPSGGRSHVWDIKAGKELPAPAGGQWFAWVFAFAPDGKSIVGTTASGQLRAWSLSDAKEIQAFEKVEGRSIALAFVEKEKLIAVTTDGQSVAAWDVTRGKRLHEPITTDQFNWPLALSPDGKVFAFDTGKNVVSVRSVADGKELHRLTGHKEIAFSLAFSADGGSLAVGSRDTSVRVWDVATGKERSKWETTAGGLPIVALSPDGKTVATGGPNHPHAVLFWDAATGKRRKDFAGHTGPIYSLSFSPDGKQVATASSLRGEEEVRIWEAAAGRLLHEFTAHKSGVSAVAFSPDGKKLATAGWWSDRTVKLWDPATGKEIRTFTGHEAGVTRLAFSPDSRRLASADAYYNRMGRHEGRVCIWDVATGKEVAVLADHRGYVRAVAFEPGGPAILVGANGVHTYDAASGEHVGEPFLPDRPIEALALSPDGKVLMTLDSDLSVQLWELATRREILGLNVTASSLAFSPDGRFVAVGTDDGVRVFGRVHGAERLALRGTRGVVGALAFSPDGRLLAGAGTHDTSALVWDVSELAKDTLAAPPRADAAAFKVWWEALKGTDAGAADRAAWALAGIPDKAVPWLKASLPPVKEPDPKPVVKLIADLDDDKYDTRERAYRELAALGEAAEGRLRQALKDKPTVEQRRRIENLLGRLKDKPIDWDRIRGIRAVAVLEQIGTPEAQEVLRTLARGAPEAALTRDAHAALKRLEKRQDAPKGKEP